MRNGEHRWFGPRSDYLGWGWRPTTWQGWLVVITYLVVTFAAGLAFRGAALVLTLSAITLGLLGLLVFKGGKPGSGWSRN